MEARTSTTKASPHESCTRAFTAAPASAAVSGSSPVYTRQFFANTTFSSTPKKTDCDSVIDENWGTGAPASGLPKDNFGVRWSVTRDFGSGGPFALPVTTQDGIHVYLDGTRRIDLWKNVSATERKTVNITIPSGKHTLRVDFVNWTGTAEVVTATELDTTPSVPTPEGSPLSVQAYPAEGDEGNEVRWNGLGPSDPETAGGYRVYRWNPVTATYQKIAELGSEAFFHFDTGARRGTTSYYWVTAVAADGTESLPSGDSTVTEPVR
ncbi:PA14 domain-containing protein [Streptomyces sp. NPDC059255]|uniref:PA14 domain-containing protein n=1 Tax=Streptomyces sp. NPDC059255 TaxID=3346793 RepID=UPI0036CE4423